MSKTVQIPEDLFLDLCKYHLGEVSSEESEERIKRGLQDKLNRMVARQEYSERKSLS